MPKRHKFLDRTRSTVQTLRNGGYYETVSIPRPLHPTPDKVRANWMNLNGPWDFSFETPTFDRQITVPFSWESPLSGIGEEYKGTGWYRRTISYDPGSSLLFLHLSAVDYECDVFVNGVHLAHHFGGYTPSLQR